MYLVYTRYLMYNIYIYMYKYIYIAVEGCIMINEMKWFVGSVADIVFEQTRGINI